MFSRLLTQKKRKTYLARTTQDDMRWFLATDLPARNALSSDLEYLAVDLEMSGLNAHDDQILSIGFVPIINRRVEIKQANHFLIQGEQVDLSETAPIHKLRDIDLVEGTSLKNAMSVLLKALSGRVLVLHHAPLDKTFLDTACLKLYEVPLLALTIDTLAIEKKRNQRHQSKTNLSVRLGESRRRYNLPDYLGHNAVVDAIATAELWLAQLSHITADKPTKLSYFLKTN